MSESSSSLDKLLKRKVTLREKKAKKEDKPWYKWKSDDSDLKSEGKEDKAYLEDEEKDEKILEEADKRTEKELEKAAKKENKSYEEKEDILKKFRDDTKKRRGK